MSRKVVRLTVDHLAQLDEHLRTCLRWQLDAVAISRVEPGQEAAEVEAWLSGVLREWGSCGRTVLVDGVPVGAAVYAPPWYLPGLAALPTAPPSQDAVVLAKLYVAEAFRGQGLGRMLIQGMARDLVLRETVAVEAFGRNWPQPGSCLLPVEFLGAVGFKTQRAHRTVPRMRMELRTTRTWKSEVELAVERLYGAVRPALSPQRLKPQAKGSLRSGPRAP
ncbi:GNAT family N-acetyltransferase [Nocardioides houyundeii]|uniref:GNAT family N-acetyltransferase n=1 Tax=Nocardioides houyundeii TaxID=2045452 RepID=UPI000C76002F|nr:GNAT family N-acetyltransferase [Nocardioides houyundeii]